MEPTTLIPMLENNLTPLVVWVLMYFTMFKGIRKDLDEIKTKLDKE